MNEPLPKDELTETLSVSGALLVADATVFDAGDMKNIALKVLAHQFRVIRKEGDEQRRDIVRWENAHKILLAEIERLKAQPVSNMRWL